MRPRRTPRAALSATEIAAVVMMLWTAPARAQAEFPFGRELILDADRMVGSRRVPNMDVDEQGAFALEMWCHKLDGTFVVAGETLRVADLKPTMRQCDAERMRRDDEMLAALLAVTSWRRKDSTVTLLGPTPLMFRIPTN